jgi:hypothetical protein
MSMLGLSTAMAQAPGPAAAEATPQIAAPTIAWPMPPVQWEGEGITDLTRQQIAEVEGAVRPYNTTDAARAARYRPAFGMIPTMGEHWVNNRGMRRDVDRLSPPHLMFSLINGKEELVGAAYAFTRTPDAPVPDAFDGTADYWHDHPELAAGDQTLTMLHVWFVPSPDGPFAGHNPWLPFWAVGMQPPDAARLADPVDGPRIRTVSVALAEMYGSVLAGTTLAGLIAGPEVRAKMDESRARIAALLPDLRKAQEEGDVAAWNNVADQMVVSWKALQEARLAAIPLPALKERLAAFYEEMLTGGHGHAAHVH